MTKTKPRFLRFNQTRDKRNPQLQIVKNVSDLSGL